MNIRTRVRPALTHFACPEAKRLGLVSILASFCEHLPVPTPPSSFIAVLTPNYFLLDTSDDVSSIGYSVSASGGIVSHGRRGEAAAYVLEKPNGATNADLEADPVAMRIAHDVGFGEKPGVISSNNGELAAFAADRGLAIVLSEDGSCSSQAACWLERGYLNRSDLAWSTSPSTAEI